MDSNSSKQESHLDLIYKKGQNLAVHQSSQSAHTTCSAENTAVTKEGKRHISSNCSTRRASTE